MNGNLSIDEAHDYNQDRRAYFKKLFEIKSRPNIVGRHSLESELEYQALRVVRVVNDLHD